METSPRSSSTETARVGRSETGTRRRATNCRDQVVLTQTTLDGTETIVACYELRVGPAVDLVSPGNVDFLAAALPPSP